MTSIRPRQWATRASSSAIVEARSAPGSSLNRNGTNGPPRASGRVPIRSSTRSRSRPAETTVRSITSMPFAVLSSSWAKTPTRASSISSRRPASSSTRWPSRSRSAAISTRSAVTSLSVVSVDRNLVVNASRSSASSKIRLSSSATWAIQQVALRNEAPSLSNQVAQLRFGRHQLGARRPQFPLLDASIVACSCKLGLQARHIGPQLAALGG